jgi:3-oxoacyl-[acyl-carrier protein] reductase
VKVRKEIFMGRLEGKICVITGSARGLGREMGLRFAREGANIVIVDVLTSEMEATARDIRELGREAISVKTDVSKKEDVAQMVNAAIERFERIDILVNDAGIVDHAPLLEMSEEAWDRVIAIDLKGVFLCTQAVAKHMVKRRQGKIINIASSTGLGSFDPRTANYATAKAGVIQLTKSTAKELGPYNINVNAIAPGMIVTEMLKQNRTPEQLEEFIKIRKEKSVLGKAGTPQDIANLALFLASDESAFISGQVIACDGGRFDRM